MLRRLLAFHLTRRPFHSSFHAPQISPFLLADIGEGITECEVTQWFVKAGDTVAQFDKICEVQSDKASVEITSRFDGTITKLHYTVGQMAKVGAPIVDIDTPDAVSTSKSTPPKAVSAIPMMEQMQVATPNIMQSVDESAQEDLNILTTPAVRRVAREYNVNLAKVKGTGKQSRILKEDVLNYVQSGQVPATTKTEPSIVSSTKTIPTTKTTTTKATAIDEYRPLSAIQKAMFKTMSRSLAIPHFGYSDEIIMNNVSRLRKDINHMLEKQYTSLGLNFKSISYMPILIKTFSMALTHYPLLNGCLVDSDDVTKAKLLMRASHNIGVAMDTLNGLIVPNIKDVQDKSILEIASELSRLQEASKRNAITSTDLQGGSISVSNIGAIGGTYMSPVVVPTELCIVAIGQIRRLPRFEIVKSDHQQQHGQRTIEEKVVAQEVSNFSFCADHRVVDGATVARFAQRWKQYLQNPYVVFASMR